MKRIRHYLKTALTLTILATFAQNVLGQWALWSVTVEGDLRKNYANKTVMPEFPMEAKEKGLQGLVVVKVEVDAKGNLSEAALYEAPVLFRVHDMSKPYWGEGFERRGPFLTDAILVNAVINALKQWKFKSFDVADRPSAVRSVLTFRFVIENGEARVEDGPEAAWQEGSIRFPKDNKPKDPN